MIEPIQDVFMIGTQRDEDTIHGIPKLVLQTLNDSSSQSETLNTVTRGQAKIVLHTIQDPKKIAPPKQVGSSVVSTYDLFH